MHGVHTVTFHISHLFSTQKQFFKMQALIEKQCAEISLYSFNKGIWSIHEKYRYLLVCVFVDLGLVELVPARSNVTAYYES